MSDSALELRSRRALLTGGFAGLAALVASAVLRPLPTEPPQATGDNRQRKRSWAGTYVNLVQ